MFVNFRSIDAMTKDVYITTGCHDNHILGMFHDGATNPIVRLQETTNLVKARFRGVLVKRTSVQSIATATFTAVSWQAEEYDTDGLWVIGSPTRITIPTDPGFTKVKFTGGLQWAVHATGNRGLEMRKNGAVFMGGGRDFRTGMATDEVSNNAHSAVVTVAAADYFELFGYQSSGGNLNLQGNTGTWFLMEIVE
jgi:hypothetical protein